MFFPCWKSWDYKDRFGLSPVYWLFPSHPFLGSEKIQLKMATEKHKEKETESKKKKKPLPMTSYYQSFCPSLHSRQDTPLLKEPKIKDS